MPGRKCYHCGKWLEDPKGHDCWTTTEEKLTEELSEDLMDAWLRIRETATAFGEQRIYASHRSIMFARKNCYFFVRPGKSFLEVCFFLGREIKHPFIKKTHPSSKIKTGHLCRVIHRDEVEVPFTDWLKEAYEVSETLKAVAAKKKAAVKKKSPVKKTKKKK